MEINYDWQFNPLECYPTKENNTDVVFNVHWQLYASTASYQESAIGTQSVPLPSGSVFIPFQNLTKEIVYGWVSEQIGQDRINEMTASLEKRIMDKINPPTLQLRPPWLSGSMMP